MQVSFETLFYFIFFLLLPNGSKNCNLKLIRMPWEVFINFMYLYLLKDENAFSFSLSIAAFAA